MIINFNSMDAMILPNFKGGEKEYIAKMYDTPDNCKFMQGMLEPGASIGLHKHDGNCEIVYVLKGKGKVIDEGAEYEVSEGMCHYCPNQGTHSLINNGEENLVFFAAVVRQ